MQSSSTFIRISGLIPEVKKSALINYYENIIAYSEESEQTEMQANKCGLFQIHLEGLRGSVTSEKFDYFYPHLGLETVFPVLTLKCLIDFCPTYLFLENFPPRTFSFHTPCLLNLKKCSSQEFGNSLNLDSNKDSFHYFS